MRASSRISSLATWAAAFGIVAILTASTVPTFAAPVPSATVALKSATADSVTEVRWRGRRGGGVAAGVAAGLLFGGLLGASPYYYGGPPAYYGPPVYYPPGFYGPVYGPRYYGGSRSWLSYCFSRYRSFDPRTGTYMGYDGRRHYCR
ncbi:MAG: BA14K family protein [Rhodopseudomonas sp.]|nr:BA14K family protein [Rhodopseudomonas sp.]